MRGSGSARSSSKRLPGGERGVTCDVWHVMCDVWLSQNIERRFIRNLTFQTLLRFMFNDDKTFPREHEDCSQADIGFSLILNIVSMLWPSQQVNFKWMTRSSETGISLELRTPWHVWPAVGSTSPSCIWSVFNSSKPSRAPSGYGRLLEHLKLPFLFLSY